MKLNESLRPLLLPKKVVTEVKKYIGTYTNTEDIVYFFQNLKCNTIWDITEHMNIKFHNKIIHNSNINIELLFIIFENFVLFKCARQIIYYLKIW